MARIACLPLVEEAVFHSCRFHDGATEKELCDVMLTHRGEGILISIKAQDVKREGQRAQKWATKHGRKAIAQLGGAYRTLRERPVWCMHTSLGRRDFIPNAITPRHGIALVEVRGETELSIDDPRQASLTTGVNTSVMSVDDFCHILHYLRTWRDLQKYLDARHACLRFPDCATLGAEVALLGYYTAMRDTFRECTGLVDAKLVTAKGEHVLPGSAFRDKEAAFAAVLEDLIRGTSLTEPVALPPELSLVESNTEDTPNARVRLREDLCHLTVQERAALGEQICQLSRRMLEERPSQPLYAGVRFNRHPTDAYMVVLANNRDQPMLRAEAMDLIIAACVFHGRKTGFALILNQLEDKLRFDVIRVSDVQPSVEMMSAGQEYFGHIRERKTELAR